MVLSSSCQRWGRSRYYRTAVMSTTIGKLYACKYTLRYSKSFFSPTCVCVFKKWRGWDRWIHMHTHMLPLTAWKRKHKKHALEINILPRGVLLLDILLREENVLRSCGSGKKHHNSHWAQKIWLRNLNVITQSLAFLLKNPFILEIPWYCKSDN